MPPSDDGAQKTTVDKEKQGSCVHCNRPDSYDNYVQCDRCSAWWHYLCAGVSDSIANRSFTCEACLHVSVSSHVSSSSSRVAAMQLRLREMEAQCKLARQELENERLAFEAERKTLQQRNNQLQQQGKQRTAEWVDRHAGNANSADGQGVDREAAAATNLRDDELRGRPTVQEGPHTLSSSLQAAINTAVQAAVQAALQATNSSKGFQHTTGAEIPIRNTGAIPKTAPKDLTSTRIGTERGSERQKGKQDLPPPPEKPPGKPLENQTISSNYNQWIQELSKKFCNTNLDHATATTVPPHVESAPLRPALSTRTVQHSQQHSASDCNNVQHILPNIDIALGVGQNVNNSNNNVQSNVYPGSINVLGSSGMPTYVPTPSQLAARV
ncbi:uncharacterized protein LOC110675191 [Aedes aegypti]|uniref:Uncharacterized protein n=1 Tax=Aedes aegypti TaxID=7159 RepID=A0A6I8U7Y1_AEDAE|nr:uncharacterized protein LOC110675191 [Aedes aegypti]